MKPSNEFCISFLKGSGWLDNHDEEVRTEAIKECIEIVKNSYRMDAIEKLEQLKEHK